MLLGLVNRISSERRVKKFLDIQVWVLSRSSRGRPENILGMSRINVPGRPLNVRLRRPLDVILGRPQDVRLQCPRDVRSGRPRDGQIGSSGVVLRTLEGTYSGRPGDQYLPAGNIVRKSKKYFRRKTEKLCDSAVAVRLLIFIRLTAERDNLIRFYGWSIHYIGTPK